MNDTLFSLFSLVGIGLLQFISFFLITQYLARRANLKLSWLQVFKGVFVFGLIALPFVGFLLWLPPDESDRRRNLLLAAVFVPIGSAIAYGYFKYWRMIHRRGDSSNSSTHGTGSPDPG